MLSHFDEQSVEDFLRSYHRLGTGHRVENSEPSRRILDAVLAEASQGPARTVIATPVQRYKRLMDMPELLDF